MLSRLFANRDITYGVFDLLEELLGCTKASFEELPRKTLIGCRGAGGGKDVTRGPHERINLL